MPKRNAIYVLSTHWDREWYQPFQDYRHRLVDLMDHVLGGLADGRLKGPFQSDGQSIVLEDYLAIRPERRDQVKRLLAKGRIVAGPWYVMPDEFLVSGESLIRNLRKDRQLVRDLGGKPSDAGYLCDTFGHNSQIPQIMAGFGIKMAFVWRGVSPKLPLFHWVGADGTRMPAYRFGSNGYCTYCGIVRHGGSRREQSPLPQVKALLLAHVTQQSEQYPVGPILLLDGGDHQGWDERNYQAVTQAMADANFPFGLTHGSLDDYARRVASAMKSVTAEIVGELREPGIAPASVDHAWVIPGVASSRIWIKQLNAATESLLCDWAEPAAAMARPILGRDPGQGFLEKAWEYLLKNHPHDSICGCSIDAVHQDNAYRFRQAAQIAEGVTSQSQAAVTASIKGDVGSRELRLALFNALSQAVDEVVEVTLPIPSDWPTFNEFFGYEPKPAFKVLAADGSEVAVQRIAQKTRQTRRRLPPADFPRNWSTTEVTVAFRGSIPACGYQAFRVVAGQQGAATRSPLTPGLATGPTSMANEFLKVAIGSDGLVELTDLRSGNVFPGLLAMEDAADIGDGWYHGQAVNDQVYSSIGARAQVALLADGPGLCRLRIRQVLSLPSEFQIDRMVRSSTFTDVVVEHTLTLRAGSLHLEVETRVDNRVCDHRMRVLMPTGCDADSYLVDTPFDVVRCPVALPADNHLARELATETRAHCTFATVNAAGRGLAVVSAGLPEVAVRDLPDRPIALTLFRSFRRTVMTTGEPEGQIQGPLTFNYWLVPQAGEADVVGLMRLGQKLAAGVRSVCLTADEVAPLRTSAALPAAASLIEVTGPVVMTSARWVNGGLEVRVLNPTESPVDGAIKPRELAGKLSKVREVNLESRPAGPVSAVPRSGVKVKLGAKAILTLRFTP